LQRRLEKSPLSLQEAYRLGDRHHKSLTDFTRDEASENLVEELAKSLAVKPEELRQDAKYAAALEQIGTICGADVLAALLAEVDDLPSRIILRLGNLSPESMLMHANEYLAGRPLFRKPKARRSTKSYGELLARLTRVGSHLESASHSLRMHGESMTSRQVAGIVQTCAEIARLAREVRLDAYAIPVGAAQLGRSLREHTTKPVFKDKPQRLAMRHLLLAMEMLQQLARKLYGSKPRNPTTTILKESIVQQAHVIGEFAASLGQRAQKLRQLDAK
jgi:hypothetical protein